MDYMTGGGMAQTNVVMTAQQPQNFSYCSNAFDFSRGPRSKVLEAPTGFVPGPGAYDIAEPIHDYRGVYKNMGKKKNKKGKKKEHAEGEESEEESEPEPSEKEEDSEHDGEEKTKRDQPDMDEHVQEEEMKPEGTRKDLIPGQSIGKGIRTQKADPKYPGPGTYKKLPTDFPPHILDKRKEKEKYEKNQREAKQQQEAAKKMKHFDGNLGPGHY